MEIQILISKGIWWPNLLFAQQWYSFRVEEKKKDKKELK